MSQKLPWDILVLLCCLSALAGGFSYTQLNVCIHKCKCQYWCYRRCAQLSNKASITAISMISFNFQLGYIHTYTWSNSYVKYIWFGPHFLSNVPKPGLKSQFLPSIHDKILYMNSKCANHFIECAYETWNSYKMKSYKRYKKT